MKVTVRDTEILKTIEINQLRDYLQSHGWYEDRDFLTNATIWLNRDRDELEILLPLRNTLKDYAMRIGEAIEILELAENRSQLEILSDLLTRVANITIQAVVMQINSPNPEPLSGEITLIGAIADKLRKIHTELFDNDYILAIKAYQERIPVVITGDLIKENNRFILKQSSYFALDEVS